MWLTFEQKIARRSLSIVSRIYEPFFTESLHSIPKSDNAYHPEDKLQHNINSYVICMTVV